MTTIFIWDNPGVGVAYNLDVCENCGKLVKEMVWDKPGVSVCPAGEHIGKKASD